jgi:hypothetical protein
MAAVLLLGGVLITGCEALLGTDHTFQECVTDADCKAGRACTTKGICSYGDGLPDLAVTNDGDNTVAVLLNECAP